jgi:DNA-binding transcriptional LysR family regulator
MLLAGMGIARAADFLVAEDIRGGRLVPLLRDFAVDERTDIHIIYPHRKHLAAKVRAFVDFLAPRLAGSPWMM